MKTIPVILIAGTLGLFFHQDAAEPPLGLNAEPGMHAHLTRWKHGVQPLTKENLPIALRGDTREGGYVPERDPFVLRIALLNAKQIPPEPRLSHDTAFRVEQAQKSWPYIVRVTTPFTRTADAGAVARRKYDPPPTINLAAENARGVQIVVIPQTIVSDPIEKFLVKRGQTIISPTGTGGAVPIDLQNLFGAKVAQAVGVYSFPLSVFQPKGEPMTLVFVGRSNTIEWPMSDRELMALR